MADTNVSQSHLSEEFMKEFNVKKDLVSNRIKQMSADNGNVDEQLSEISNEIQKMSKTLHDAIMFLPSYSVKIRQNEIRDLERLLKDKEDALVPKKKFGFKSKLKPANTKDPSNTQQDTSIPQNPDVNKGPSVTTNFFTIENITQGTAQYEDADLTGNDVLVKDSENCEIILAGAPSTLRLVNLKNCKLICGPVQTSIFVDKVFDSDLVLCCQQLRTHSSERLDIYLRVASRAIIEDCTKIRFGPYNWSHEKLEEWHKRTEIDPNLERYDAIDDFNWLSATQSPNWTLIPENERRTFNKSI